MRVVENWFIRGSAGKSELQSSVVMLPLSLLSLLSCLALLGSAAADLGSGSGSGSGSAAAPSSPPRNLEVSMVTATTALVSWDPPLSPNGVVVSYNISYQPSDGRSAASPSAAGWLASTAFCVCVVLLNSLTHTQQQSVVV